MEKKFMELMVKETLDKEEINELCHTISGMVNNYSFHAEEIVDEILKSDCAKAKMNEFSACWLKILQYEKENPWLVDGRNQIAVEKGAKLSGQKPVKDFMETYAAGFIPKIACSSSHPEKGPLGSAVAVFMSREHRTLQQTLSKMVFCYLNKQLNLEELEEGWWKCPLI